MPKAYSRALVGEKSLGKSVGGDFSAGSASRMPESGPQVSKKLLAGHVGPTHE